MLSLQGKDWTCSSYAERSQCSKMRLGAANGQKCDLASAELSLFMLCRA